MKHASSLEPLESRIAPAAGVFALSNLDGNNGFKIPDERNGDSSGYSVSGAGDVNGNGYDDFIIDAINNHPNGAGYVVFGKAGGFGSELSLASLDGTNGFKILGEANGDGASESVAPAM